MITLSLSDAFFRVRSGVPFFVSEGFYYQAQRNTKNILIYVGILVLQHSFLYSQSLNVEIGLRLSRLNKTQQRFSMSSAKMYELSKDSVETQQRLSRNSAYSVKTQKTQQTSVESVNTQQTQ